MKEISSFKVPVKFFTANQNLGQSLKFILTKFELSASCCFQDIAVQSQQFSSYSSVAILPVLRQKLKSWLEFTWKVANLQFWPFTPLSFDNNTAPTTYWELYQLQTCSNFLKFRL